MRPGQPRVDLCKAAVFKGSLSTQTQDDGETHGNAPADHFSGAREMICYTVCSKWPTLNPHGNRQGMLDRSKHKAWIEKRWSVQA